MSKAVYVQRGESLDYKNSGSAKIVAGDVVLIGSVLGVAGCDIEVGAVGSLHVEGVYKLTKTGTSAISVGAVVYYDGSGITDAAGETASPNTRVGYAVASAAAADAEILVKINA